MRRFRDQLQLDDEPNSKIADGYATGSSARRGLVVGDFCQLLQRHSEPQLRAGLW